MSKFWGRFTIAMQVLAVVALSVVVLSKSSGLALRTIDLALVIIIVAFAAFFLGGHHERQAFMDSISWMPKHLHISENEDGTKVAFVEKMSGEIVTLELPEEIESAQQAVEFVLRVLDEGK